MKQLMYLNAIMKWLEILIGLFQVWGCLSVRGFNVCAAWQSWLLCQQPDGVLGNGSTGLTQYTCPPSQWPLK